MIVIRGSQPAAAALLQAARDPVTGQELVRLGVRCIRSRMSPNSQEELVLLGEGDEYTRAEEKTCGVPLDLRGPGRDGAREAHHLLRGAGVWEVRRG